MTRPSFDKSHAGTQNQIPDELLIWNLLDPVPGECRHGCTCDVNFKFYHSVLVYSLTLCCRVEMRMFEKDWGTICFHDHQRRHARRSAYAVRATGPPMRDARLRFKLLGRWLEYVCSGILPYLNLSEPLSQLTLVSNHMSEARSSRQGCPAQVAWCGIRA